MLNPWCSIVLSAIVYVLARAGGHNACDEVPMSYAPVTTSSPAGDFDIGAYREHILAQSQPYIIECAEATAGESQEACHLPREKRYAAVDQKGMCLLRELHCRQLIICRYYSLDDWSIGKWQEHDCEFAGGAAGDAAWQKRLSFGWG